MVHHLKSLSMRRQLWWQKQFRLIPLTYYQQFLSFSSYLNSYDAKKGWKIFIRRLDNLVPPIIMWKLEENDLILRIADQSRVYPFIMRNGLYFINRWELDRSLYFPKHGDLPELYSSWNIWSREILLHTPWMLMQLHKWWMHSRRKHRILSQYDVRTTGWW